MSQELLVAPAASVEVSGRTSFTATMFLGIRRTGRSCFDAGAGDDLGGVVDATAVSLPDVGLTFSGVVGTVEGVVSAIRAGAVSFCCQARKTTKPASATNRITVAKATALGLK